MIQYKNIVIIHNPVSGQHDAEAIKQTICESLDSFNVAYTYMPTKAEGDAVRWASEAVQSNDYDLIIAAGGDGTVAEILRGIVNNETTVPILILSLGTANLLSRALDLPQDFDKVLNLIASSEEGGGKEHYFDVGYIKNKDKYFCLAVGAGLDADVVRDANRKEKNRWGLFAYIIALAKRIFDRQLHTIKITYDGKLEKVRAHSVMILNASRFSVSGVHVGPAGNPHDGLLETVVMERTSAGETLQTLGQMVTGGIVKPMDLKTAKRITISSRPQLPVQADGEVIGKTPLEVIVLANAVTFLVPRNYPSSSLLQ